MNLNWNVDLVKNSSTANEKSASRRSKEVVMMITVQHTVIRLKSCVFSGAAMLSSLAN